jgi:uncharacterized protein YdiU (UPF0061 family)
MSILGLTIDYGPFGFLDGFDANHICNHSDEQGRYAYGRQPAVMQWNLFRLAEALLPLIGEVEAAEAALEPFKAVYAEAIDDALRARLGLASKQPGDQELIDSLFGLLQANRADYTIFFRRLCDFDDVSDRTPARDLFLDRERFDRWAVDYRTRLGQDARDPAARRVAMRAVNPKYVLRNHLAETAIERARQRDYSEVERLASLLRNPFDEQPGMERYAELPPDWAGGLEVSCSS